MNGIGKGILVLCTYPINFYGVLTWEKITELTLDTWAFKMLIAVLLLLLIKPLKWLNQKVDQVDVFDFGVRYSPFKMFSRGNYGKNYFGKTIKK